MTKEDKKIIKDLIHEEIIKQSKDFKNEWIYIISNLTWAKIKERIDEIITKNKIKNE